MYTEVRSFGKTVDSPFKEICIMEILVVTCGEVIMRKQRPKDPTSRVVWPDRGRI